MSSLTPAASAVSTLVTLKDGKPVTTSQIVAESFGKRHDNVLRDIGNIIASAAYRERCVLNFEETSAAVSMIAHGVRYADRKKILEGLALELRVAPSSVLEPASCP